MALVRVCDRCESDSATTFPISICPGIHKFSDNSSGDVDLCDYCWDQLEKFLAGAVLESTQGLSETIEGASDA